MREMGDACCSKKLYRNKFNNNHNNLTRQEHGNNFQNQNFNIVTYVDEFMMIGARLLCVWPFPFLIDLVHTQKVYLFVYIESALIGDSRHNF